MSSKRLDADAAAQRLELTRAPWLSLGRVERHVRRAQRPLILSGILGLVVVGLISIPGNRVFDVNLRSHQLIGMLFSHASVLAVLLALSPLRSRLLASARSSTPGAWLGWSLLACASFIAAWLAVFPLSPDYMNALTRESGPLEPLQAALYTVASWLGWQCMRRSTRPDERRLFCAAALVCAWLALEEVEYFGVFELTVGGRIHGVWVRAVHDFIALGVKVPAVRSALVTLAVVVAGGLLLYIGPRCILHQAASLAAVPAVLAVITLALSQVLDGHSRLLGYRLEEPLELVTSFLMNVALAIKYGEAPGGG